MQPDGDDLLVAEAAGDDADDVAVEGGALLTGAADEPAHALDVVDVKTGRRTGRPRKCFGYAMKWLRASTTVRQMTSFGSLSAAQLFYCANGSLSFLGGGDHLDLMASTGTFCL